MARRTPLTEVGFVACDDLGDLGAGRREGWLADGESVHAALHHHSLTLAGPTLVLVLRWGGSLEYGGMTSPPVKIRPALSPAEGVISAVEWLVAGDLVALALGTSGGYLLLYSLEPEDLIHKQIVHPGRVLKLRFREVEDESRPDTPSQELCVVMPGIIARFDGADIKSLLERRLETHTNGWDRRNQKMEDREGGSFGRIPYQLWNVSKFGPCADAAITGIMPPPLLELESQQRHYCAVTIGDDAVISAFRISEDRSRSLVGAILSKVVPAAFSTISSFSKMIWRSEQASAKKPEAAPQPFARASPLTCLKDHPRKGEKLTLSPSGSLAAITDSLGRILLLDTRALVVVRLWKGYRDANCLFMEMLVGKDKGKSVSLYDDGHTKADYCLCLAIHAPRKGIIEVWKMRTGPRVLTIQCPKGSRILQPSSRIGSSMTSASYIPLKVFVFNGDSGQLAVLNRSIG